MVRSLAFSPLSSPKLEPKTKNHRKPLCFELKAKNLSHPNPFCQFWSKSDGPNAYVSHSKSTCAKNVILCSKNVAKTVTFYTTFRLVAISSFLLPKNIEFSLRFPLQIDMCKSGNFTFSKRWFSLGKSHTFGKQKWPSGTMSIWSGKRNHFDHHFWTKSDKISKTVKLCP